MDEITRLQNKLSDVDELLIKTIDRMFKRNYGPYTPNQLQAKIDYLKNYKAIILNKINNIL